MLATSAGGRAVGRSTVSALRGAKFYATTRVKPWARTNQRGSFVSDIWNATCILEGRRR